MFRSPRFYLPGRAFLAVVFVAFAIGLAPVGDARAETGYWIYLGRMMSMRHAHTATLLPDGKVLVAGGEMYSQELATAEIYNPTTRAWTLTGSMAHARMAHTATLLSDGKVLVTGGWRDPPEKKGFMNLPVRSLALLFTAPRNSVMPGEGYSLGGDGGGEEYGRLTSAELYDPKTGLWSPAGNMRNGRSHHSAALLTSGKVLVVGDWSQYAELYDPQTGSWSSAGYMNRSRVFETATLLPNGKVLVAGGEWFDRSAELYDPGMGTWTLTEDMTVSRSRHTATLLLNGKVLLAGGASMQGFASGAELFDPDTGHWTAAGSMVNTRRLHTATLLPNGNVLVAGGANTEQYTPLASVELFDPNSGEWTLTDPLQNARYDHTATLLHDGAVLVAAGMDNTGGTQLDSVELYQQMINSWTPTSSMISSHQYHAAARLLDGKILVVGGTGDLNNNAELYDPEMDEWSPTGKMVNLTIPRMDLTATLLSDGRVLAVGGNDKDLFLPSEELYNPITNLWTSTGSLWPTRWGHTATLLSNGKVLVAGGRAFVDINTQPLTSAELFDPATGTWTATGSMITMRYWHTAILLPDGNVLVAGGNARDGHEISSAEIYNPTSGKWTSTGDLYTPRSLHTATMLQDGKVLVAGGYRRDPSSNIFYLCNPAELYDSTTGRLTETGSLLSGRLQHTATLLHDGKVLVTGGSGKFSEVFASTEVYDPVTGSWEFAGNMNSQRRVHTATLLINGDVLVAGGEIGGATTERYSPPVRESSRPAGVLLFNLRQYYNGTPRAAIVQTTPPGLIVSVTYEGTADNPYGPSSQAPTQMGEYLVRASIVSPEYQGSASTTLVITNEPSRFFFPFIFQ